MLKEIICIDCQIEMGYYDNEIVRDYHFQGLRCKKCMQILIDVVQEFTDCSCDENMKWTKNY